MKSILAPLCLTLALLLTVSEASAQRRYRDNDDYREVKKAVEKSWDSTQKQYYHVLELQRRYGTGYRLRRDFARADALYREIRHHLRTRDASYEHVRGDISELRSITAHIRSEYSGYTSRPRYREVPRDREVPRYRFYYRD